MESRTQFGSALLSAHAEDFDGAPAAAGRLAAELIDAMTEWLDAIEVPPTEEGTDWGAWIILTAGTGPVGAPSDALRELLMALDENAEPEQELGRYLGQIWPLGEDRALAESAGVRIMTMAGAKGLTVRATIVAALEDEIIPRQEPPLVKSVGSCTSPSRARVSTSSAHGHADARGLQPALEGEQPLLAER